MFKLPIKVIIMDRNVLYQRNVGGGKDSVPSDGGTSGVATTNLGDIQ